MNGARFWCVVVAGMAALTGCDGSGGGADAGDAEVVDGQDGAATCGDDGACSDGMFCNGVERCVDGVCAPASGPACDADMVCDEAMDRCGTICELTPDRDGDGHDSIECGGDDCDDADAARFPGNVEVCDGTNHDEDCDPGTFGARDLDGDGVVDATCCNASSDGTLTCGADCNDAVRSIQPGASEVCDAVDNDCDTTVDEGVSTEVYPDLDFDGHGDQAAAVLMGCAGRLGFSALHDDCDDAAPNRHPGLLEACDEVDNDCDGTTDESTVELSWYLDADGDGFGDRSSPTTSCAPPSAQHVLTPLDCDDGDAAVFPGATELCDGADNDCNGSADFRISPTDTEDDDFDGHGDAACGGDDCRDRDRSSYGGAVELCDDIDNDCDMMVDDETSIQDWFPDDDADGYGARGATAIRSCPPVAGRAPNDGDCDDADPAIHPGATELCDDVDDDCDGEAQVQDADGDELAPVALACTVGAGGAPLPRLDCDDTQPGFNLGDWAHCGTCGNGCGGQEACVAGSCAPARRVFISSVGHDGDFGGLAGADAMCQGLADAAALGGTWKAYMVDGASGLERLEHPDVPFIRLDGVRIADDWADLSNSSIQAPLNISEQRQEVHNNVWTGLGGQRCQDWTFSGGGCLAGSSCGHAGESGTVDSHWDGFYVFHCNSGYHVYCIEQ